MSLCPHCCQQFTESQECPHCNEQVPASIPSETAGDFLSHYIKTVRAILFTPTAFFRQMPLSGGLSRPLAFALATHWIASLFSYFWSVVAGTGIERFSTHLKF